MHFLIGFANFAVSPPFFGVVLALLDTAEFPFVPTIGQALVVKRRGRCGVLMPNCLTAFLLGGLLPF